MRNDCGQLGHGDKKNINTPKLVRTSKDIQKYLMGIVGTILLPKTRKIKYLSPEITLTCNLEQEMLKISFNSQKNKLKILHHLGRMSDFQQKVLESNKNCFKIVSNNFMVPKTSLMGEEMKNLRNDLMKF